VAILLVVLALASACDLRAMSRVSVHGDSIAAQASTNLRNRLTANGHRVARFDATERALISDKLTSIRRMARDNRPDVAIIVLGAGDANARHGDARLRSDIRAVLQALQNVPCVRWLSLKIRGVSGWYAGYVDRADDVNRILANQVAAFPNARVAPYREWAAGHPGAFLADGMHHNAQGKTRFAAFVEQVVDNPSCT
jgi:hypothetical protein